MEIPEAVGAQKLRQLPGVFFRQIRQGLHDLIAVERHLRRLPFFKTVFLTHRTGCFQRQRNVLRREDLIDRRHGVQGFRAADVRHAW